MTTLDATKLSRIKTQVGVFPALTKERLMLLAQAIWDAAQAEQREEDAKICDSEHGTAGDAAAAIRSQK